MASEPTPIRVQEPIRFGADFELDVSARRLRRGSHSLKLERIPLEILILLIKHRGEIVTRDEIVEEVWGKGVFLDTDNSVRGAVRKIRQALKDNPEHPQFVQTVTGRGYRFIASENRADPSNGQPSTVPESIALLQTHRLCLEEEEKEGTAEMPVDGESDHGPRAAPRVHRWAVLGGMIVLALLAVTYVVTRTRAGDATRPKINSLAVLPLKNLAGDPTQEYLADGMTEALIGRLSAIHDLRVISRTSMMRFKDTQLSVPEIARTLRVDAIVEGSLIREGTRIRVHAQLIRGATDEHFWSASYDRELRDVLAFESEIAQSIASRVAVTVTGKEHAKLTAVRSVSPEVYESYLKGRFILEKSNNRADVEKSIRYFEDAIKRDPTFAPAYVGLASTHDTLSLIFVGAPPELERPKILSAVRKALELDPELGDAHVLLAGVYQRQWRWADAEAEYERALELNANDAAAHLGLAEWLLCKGHSEEALTWARRGRKLDPLQVSGVSIGWILFSARRYEDAIQEFRSALAIWPDDAFALWQLGVVLIANRQPEEAIPALEKAVSISNRSAGVIGVLVSAYAHAGRRKEALRLVNELKRRREKGYVPAAALLNAYLGLGDYDEAFAWFERAYQEQSNILQYLKIFPVFDPVRNDPRFADLVRRVGFD